MNKILMTRALLASTVLLAGLMTATAVKADRGDWHGDYRHFDRGGRWYHGDHDGRFGWWWIAGPGLWYFQTRPAWPYAYPRYRYEYPYEYPYGYSYEYPNPPVVVVPPSQPAAPPPPQQYWYYCEGAKAYYPYVSTCPGGWRKVPVTPPAVDQR